LQSYISLINRKKKKLNFNQKPKRKEAFFCCSSRFLFCFNYDYKKLNTKNQKIVVLLLLASLSLIDSIKIISKQQKQQQQHQKII
jgi:hypothetical protein